jgi:hypothetical protein
MIPTTTANGYEALRKYDTNNDGFIDANDGVFSQLRLWHDLNGDGIAQPNELVTLDAAGIQAIDLSYDSNYQEVDKYGNEIKSKSVVVMKGGALNLIYDVWFRLL